jgi:hypothetical protein
MASLTPLKANKTPSKALRPKDDDAQEGITGKPLNRDFEHYTEDVVPCNSLKLEVFSFFFLTPIFSSTSSLCSCYPHASIEQYRRRQGKNLEGIAEIFFRHSNNTGWETIE